MPYTTFAICLDNFPNEIRFDRCRAGHVPQWWFQAPPYAFHFHPTKGENVELVWIMQADFNRVWQFRGERSPAAALAPSRCDRSVSQGKVASELSAKRRNNRGDGCAGAGAGETVSKGEQQPDYPVRREKSASGYPRPVPGKVKFRFPESQKTRSCTYRERWPQISRPLIAREVDNAKCGLRVPENHHKYPFRSGLIFTRLSASPSLGSFRSGMRLD